MKHTPEVRAYYGAKARYTNPEHRDFIPGVRFLFADFMQFYREIGPRPSTSHSLHRKDRKGNYELGNVLWVARVEREHWLAGTPENVAFHSAKARCSNPKHRDFARYGGRGVKFFFIDFQQFYQELGPRPSPDHSVDRKDNLGNYEPGNVRWATKSEQERNKRPGMKRKRKPRKTTPS
jgi:hypothetical protein